MTIPGVVVLGVAGCVVGCLAPGVVDDRPGEGATAQATVGNDCDMSGCGSSNSPEIDHRGVHDLDSMEALFNDNGFRIASYSKNGIRYRAVVDKATLTGRDLNTGAIVLHDGGTSATSLKGSRFVVVNPKYNTEYVIQIDDVGTAEYWAKPGGHVMTTPTYFVNWIASHNGEPLGGGIWKNICHSPPADDIDTFGMNRFHAVLFEGDRISAPNKNVYAVDKRWFNIGCASHALAKQHLDGHTQGAMATSPEFTTTLAERTSHLKMLAGDYCGKGVALTMAGTKLNWRDHRGWFPYVASTVMPPYTPALEARWSVDGATCLNTPRLAAQPPTTESLMYFPDIWGAIKDACIAAGRYPLPTCPPTANDFFGSHILSANP